MARPAGLKRQCRTVHFYIVLGEIIENPAESCIAFCMQSGCVCIQNGNLVHKYAAVDINHPRVSPLT